jgi:CRISPR type III-associated protein (TIGR04423 family)
MKIEIEDFWNLVNSEGWQGYIWRISDESRPTKYKLGDLIQENENRPLYDKIIEANMYHEVDKLSLHVKQIDGQTYAYKYALKGFGLPNFKLSEEEVYPSSKKDLGLLKFRDLYTLKGSNISGEGFKTWIQVAQIFVGFKN